MIVRHFFLEFVASCSDILATFLASHRVVMPKLLWLVLADSYQLFASSTMNLFWRAHPESELFGLTCLQLLVVVGLIT